MSNQDDFMSGGESLKFEKVGDTHKGKLVSITSRADTDPTGTVKKWDDGTPKKVFMWEMEQEDGTLATMWVRGNLVKVLREAAQKSGAKKQADLMGAQVFVKHHALGEASAKGFAKPKLFQAKIELAPEGERQGTVQAEYDPFADE